MRALAVLDRRVGPDAGLYLIRADVLWHSGAPDEAMRFAQEAVRVEPDAEYAWNMLAVRYVMLKDYSRAIWVYRSIQTRFGRKFDRGSFESNSQMADFVQSEPDLRPAWDALAKESVRLKSYSKAVATYQSMQSRFNLRYTRDIFVRDPDLVEFVQSAEFQKWLPQ